MSPRVGVVILSWNGRQDTLACLASLRRLDYPSVEVVVVDNGSTDDSAAEIRARFPEVRLIENGRNLGFAGGSNVGIADLLTRPVDYVLLLNNDTEVAPDMLAHLVAVGEREPSVGMLGPKIYYYDQASVIWSAGGTIGSRGQTSHRLADQVDDGADAAVRDVDYATGCALLVRRAVVEQIGPLDERFFAYFEESEWCARARRAGWRVVYVPAARMWHKIQPQARGASRVYLYLMARNRLLFLRCGRASAWTMLLAALDLLRTATTWTIRPRYKEMRPRASALARGVLDFARGRFGAPPEVV